MAIFTRAQAEFLRAYSQDLESYRKSAESVKGLIRAILERQNVPIHVIEARAKDPNSLRRKIFNKGYENPARELTDLIGVRVIMFYEEDVQTATTALRSEFAIDEVNSVDKTSALNPNEFGYRSVHLVASLKGHRLRAPEYSALKGHSFEIQIRSVLDHAWAEIQHEVVYKAGVSFPSETSRRFASLAGMIEILSREFSRLRDEKLRLIELEVERMNDGQSWSVPLNTVRLCATLNLVRPRGQRFSESRGLPAGIDALCTEALRRGGIKTVKKFRHALRQASLRKVVEEYAANSGQTADTVGDLVVSLFVLRKVNPTIVTELFPTFASELSLAID